MGRKIELVMEDSVNPQTASAKAERLIERDKVAMIIGEISSASGLAIGQVANRLKTVFINTGCNSDALRGASCNPYMFHIEAANSMYVRGGRQLLAAREPGEGQEVVLADGRLRLRPRPRQGRQEVHGEARRPVRRRRAGADRRHRLQPLSPEDPPGAARHRRLEPRRQPDHQLHQAVCRVRPAVPGRRLRLRHRRRLGRRQGQFLRHLAARLAPPRRYALLEEIRRGVPEEIRQARPRTSPGATTTRSRSSPSR